MARRKTTRGTYTISVVAEQFNIHPQTLRLYERGGLVQPSRTEGNTRMYSEVDLGLLDVILSLTRDLGVNLAGVEIILNMRDKMGEMQRQMQEFVSYVTEKMGDAPAEPPPSFSTSLVPVTRSLPLKTRSASSKDSDSAPPRRRSARRL
jgi:MerR family transcriptional regulator/heat shock protein HspR